MVLLGVSVLVYNRPIIVYKLNASATEVTDDRFGLERDQQINAVRELTKEELDGCFILGHVATGEKPRASLE